MTNFEHNLVKGQQIEAYVKLWLKRLLPDCEVINTNQEYGSKERDTYHLCDVVVVRDNITILGIECKWSCKKYEQCLDHNGWDGDYNTPLNSSSLQKYKESEFPFYVLNINNFCHKIFTADIPTILSSPKDCSIRKKTGVVIYNIDSRNWTEYDGDVKLSEIIKDILKKEKLC